MGRIQSSVGLITGTNIQSTVDQLIALSGQTRDRAQIRIKSYQSQQVAVNELTALVIGVQLQSDRLGSASGLKSTTATSSKSDVLKVRTTGSPVAGEYAVKTIQTAQTSAAASNAFTSSTDKVEAGDFVVRTGGFVDSSSNLEDLRGGLGIARGKIQLTDRSGSSREVDLTNAVTIDDVVKKINGTSGILVNAKISGDRITISDLSGSTASNLKVEEVGEGHTASDLGLSGINIASNSGTGEDLAFIGTSSRLNTLRDGRGLGFVSGTDLSVTLKDGTTLSIDLNPTTTTTSTATPPVTTTTTATPSTVGQLITAINASNSSKLEARIQSNGNGIELIDKTSGTGTFAATGSAADQLGFTGASGSSGTIGSTRLQSTLQSPLLSSLNGGQGVGTPGKIAITNRAGVTTQIELAGAVSLRDVIDRINQANVGVTANLNRSKTGIALQDTTGATTSNLVVANGDTNNTATKLKIAADVATSSSEGQALGLQYVSEATELSKLNQGRGVRLGSFTITDSAGLQAAVNLTQIAAKTVGDVIKAINDTSIGVEARLNDNGDGFVLVDTALGGGTLTIADNPNGSTARDLGIVGSATKVTVGSSTQQQIDGSQTFKLTLDGTETLEDVAKKVNDSNGPLTASLLTSGPSTVRLLFSSRASGDIGRIVAEGEDVGLSVATTAASRNAVLSVGSSADVGGTLVQSSSNVFDKVISGLELTAVGTSSDPVQISISTSNSNIEKNIQLFVDQFNKVIDKVAKEASFDEATKSTGQLFGSGEVLRIQQTLTGLISTRTFGTGKIQSLEQLGVSLDDKGKLKFDKSKLSKQLETNSSDVENYLTKKDTGFSARTKVALDRLVAIKNGSLVVRSQSLQRQVENGNKRVDGLNLRLDREREQLLKKFYDSESAISKIKSNLSAVSNIQYISK